MNEAKQTYQNKNLVQLTANDQCLNDFQSDKNIIFIEKQCRLADESWDHGIFREVCMLTFKAIPSWMIGCESNLESRFGR